MPAQGVWQSQQWRPADLEKLLKRPYAADKGRFLKATGACFDAAAAPATAGGLVYRSRGAKSCTDNALESFIVCRELSETSVLVDLCGPLGESVASKLPETSEAR